MSVKKSYVIALGLVFVVVASFIFCDAGSEDDCVREFLEGYGWECETFPTEKQEIIIPKPFDEVYKNYNEIQKKAGLDLESYAGEKCMRYTYVIKNYPEDIGEEVRANVIVCRGKCIGGDICTISLYGFMDSLIYP